MRTTNQGTFSGTLDTEIDFTPTRSGTSRARFVIDVVEIRGQRHIHNYPRCVAYGEQAKELEAKGLARGDAIEVEGPLRTGESNVVVEEQTILNKETQKPVPWDTLWIKVERVNTGDLSAANVVKISGPLNAEIDFTPTRRGTPRARFAVDMAVFHGQEEIHDLLKVTAYDPDILADLQSKNLSKGDAVKVAGSLQTRLSVVFAGKQKVIHPKTGKPVRRKIAWITAERVDDFDPDAQDEESEKASGDRPEAPSGGGQPNAKEAVEPEREDAQAGDAAEPEKASAANESTEPSERDASPGDKPEKEIRATKGAKKKALEKGIDIATIKKSSGKGGKIVVPDVEAAIEERENAGGEQEDAIQDPGNESVSPVGEEPSDDDELLKAAEELGGDPSGAEGAGQFPGGFGDEE